MGLLKRKVKTAKAYREMLLQYDWQWFCSLNLSEGSDYSKAEDRLKQWRITMGIKDHILFCYMGVFNTIPQPHVHLLMWGNRNRSEQTLLDLNHRKWEKAWSDINKKKAIMERGSYRPSHCTAVIEPIFDREGVAAYISGKNLPWDRSDISRKNRPWDLSELIQPYQKRLLRKAAIR